MTIIDNLERLFRKKFISLGETLSIERVMSHAIRSVENICSEGSQFWDVIDFQCHNLECHIFRAYIKSVVSRNDITPIMPYLGEVMTYHNACLYLKLKLYFI